jgi:photosystem II stability/assembly factor-like uncharacterized protein
MGNIKRLLILVFAALLAACIPSGPSSPTQTQPTLPPTWTPEPTEIPVLDFCQMTSQGDVTVYLRPHLDSEIFDSLPEGMSMPVDARTADGWLGFDPGIAQAANIGPFRLRWVQEDAGIQLEGPCEDLPVVEGLPPNVCFMMIMEEIPIFAAPISASRKITTLQPEDYIQVVSRTIDNWLHVDLSVGTPNLDETGWMDGRIANYNGPCMDLDLMPEPGTPIPHLQAGDAVTILAVHMISTSDGWAIGRGEGSAEHILRTEDGALTWFDVTPPEPDANDATTEKSALVSFPDENTARVAYLYGYPPSSGLTLSFWGSDDGGRAWTMNGTTGPMFLDEQPRLMSFIDSDSGWIVQNSFIGMGHHAFLLYRTLDGGDSYSRLHAPPDTESMCRKTGMTFTDGQYGWMTNECPFQQEAVYLDVSRNGGEGWEIKELSPPTQEPSLFLESLYCSTHSPVLFSAQEGKFVVSCIREAQGGRYAKRYLYSTLDGGETWRMDPLPDGTVPVNGWSPSQEILFLNPSQGWLFGRAIYWTENGGASWLKFKSVSWDGQFSFVDRLNGWAVAHARDEFALIRTRDGGKRLEEIEPQIAEEITPTVEACTLTATGAVTAYNRPSFDAEVFADLPGDMPLRVTAQTTDGWIGFDPAYAQAANIGVFRHRWVPPGSAVALTGDCDQIPVVVGPAPGVCFTMPMGEVPVYSDPDPSSSVIATLQINDYAAVNGVTMDDAWMQLDLGLGNAGLSGIGWMERNHANLNGPCMDLPTLNP